MVQIMKIGRRKAPPHPPPEGRTLVITTTPKPSTPVPRRTPHVSTSTVDNYREATCCVSIPYVPSRPV